MQPVLVFTDASFVGGNNTPKECIAEVKNAGYSHALIADNESVGALIQCYKQSQSSGAGFIAGATVQVFIEGRDSSLWYYKNRTAIQDFFSAIKQATPDPESAFSVYTDVLDQSKDPEKLKALIASTDVTAAKFKTLSKSIPKNPPSGKVTLVAKNIKGYFKLLKITSIRAINKHHNIHNPDMPGRLLCPTWEQIQSNLGDDLCALDTLKNGSVLFDAFHAEQHAEIWPLLDEYRQFCHISVSDHTSLELARKMHTGPYIPLPIARYMKPEQLEEYRVKVAVHLKGEDLEGGSGKDKVSIFDPGAPAPDPKTCLLPLEEWQSQFDNSDEFDHQFWQSIDNIRIPLGEVHLPNYDMDIKAVVSYAAALKKITPPDFSSDDEAKAWFSDWVSPDCPETVSLLQFIQRRLNDFCLHQFAAQGLEKRLSEREGTSDEVKEAYQQRFDMEFSVIESMGFSGYFLIIYDVINYARKIGVPVGDGRGSAAGSLVVYCLEVTDVDPIEYGLQFERFLNPERVSMPDIDVDFGDGIGVDRNSILRYVSEKYQQKGTEHPSSSQIANINRYQLKAALSAVRGALGLSQDYERHIKYIVKQVEASLGTKEGQSATWDEFQSNELVKAKMKREPIFAKIVKLARSLSGKRSTYGVHAGGVIISPTVITDYSAVECDSRGKFFSIYDKDDVEQAGMIKLDLLGLKTLSIIELAVKIADDTHNVKLNHRSLPKDEPDVMALVCDQHLSDIFQLESGGMRDLVSKLKPQNIGEIAVLSALYRPGALDSGMVDDFVAVKFNVKPANYEHPALQKVTQDTYGCIVYQEQVMSIVRELAGYSLGEADLLRRAMGKKKAEEMQKQKSVYTYRAQQHWREHYLAVGEKQGLGFPLDVNANDCRDIFAHFGYPDVINQHGYLAEWHDVIPFIAYLLDWTEQDCTQFSQRINDMNYVVRLFREHYHQTFISKIKLKMIDYAPERAESFAMRFYFAVSQMVRFNQIFNKVEKFAGYGFNKSHAIAYSIITYKAAFLKARYPAAFFSAALTYKDLKVLHDTVTEAKAHFGIKLLTPHINLSQGSFFPETGKSIRYGLSTLREMGDFAPVILAEREKSGPYVSLFDFISRLSEVGHKPSKGIMESLSCTGAFDTFIPPFIKQSAVNGREFIYWLRELISGCAYLGHDKGGRALLHQQIGLITPFELYVYFTTLAKPAMLKKKGFSDDLILLRKNGKKASVDLLTLPGDNADLPEKDMSMSRPVETLFNTSVQHLSDFEVEYRRVYTMMLTCSSELESGWQKDLQASCSSSIIDTLNKERHYSGMYITSNPLRVLKVADLASREPPGTYMNGYPVNVADIDSSFDRRRTSTYGIIRDVQLRTVKKEDSAYYGEKLIVFKLEDGAHTVSCMIFGSRASKQFLNKIVSDGTIALIGGEIRANEHGLTLSVEAIKRYFPTADDMLHVVPNSGKRNR